MSDVGDPVDDNLDAAMGRVAESLEPTVQPRSDEALTQQVLCRASEVDHRRWKDAAGRLGVSMAEFIRMSCNAKAADVLDCPHPLNQRRWYPWAEFCLACGLRLRKGPKK